MWSKRDLQPGPTQLGGSSVVKGCKPTRHSMGNTLFFPIESYLSWEGRCAGCTMGAVAQLHHCCLAVPYPRSFSVFLQTHCSWSCLLLGLLTWLPFLISLQRSTPCSSPFTSHSLHVWDLSQKPYCSCCSDFPSDFLSDWILPLSR